MFPDHFIRVGDVADEQHEARQEQRMPPRRVLRRSRFSVLLILTLFGLHLLAAETGVGKGTILPTQHASPGHASVQTSLAARPGRTPAVGMGAGTSSNERMGATAPAAVCLNPLDVTCWLQNAAQWVAQQITSALQPVINAILKSPLNIIGEADARRTALGAIRQALQRAEALPPGSRLGCYTGSIGVALATACIGAIFDEEELLHRAVRLLEFSMDEYNSECGFDLLSGSAGAIIALVALCNILKNTSSLEFAVRLGNELLQMADKSDAGYSWKSSALATQHNLTGFSHGTAGIGCALLELFCVTNDLQYRIAAEQAFNYERHWFDAKAGNWPDFREESSWGKRRKHQVSFSTSWCHGAPGIALSRLRAYEIVRDEQCKAEARIALQTTSQMIETTLNSGMGNYSLCHGLAGNAEVLFEGSQAPGQEWSEGSALALKVANTGIEMYASQRHRWPCGTGGDEAPGLMLGLAGIGYFYLRLYNPAIPSILILRPRNFLKKSWQYQL